MKRYALFKGDEDGNVVTFLDGEGIQELLEDPRGNYGVDEFVDNLEGYPENWSSEKGMLVEIEVLMPREKTKEWTLD